MRSKKSMDIISKVDPQKINLPQIKLSESALREIAFIFANDPDLQNSFFRVKIQGKECDGFTYSTFLSEKWPDDFVLDFQFESMAFKLAIDPFTAFYLQLGKIDFIADYQNDIEGFQVTNLRQKQFQGKFWTENQTKIPPQKNNNGL